MKSETALARKALVGIIWKFSEKIGSQLMQILIQIVLARLLLPEEYGLVGLLAIFINISDVFILQGLTTALIQKKDADEQDFSSVFLANIVVSLLIYFILFLIAPLVAQFYKEDSLTSIMRVLSLNVVIGAFAAVHNAILSRNLDFKKSFMRNISNTITQGIIGITLAVLGFGVWAMVFSKLAGTLVGMGVLWLTVRWRPRMFFSLTRVKSLFRYSSKVLGTNLLNTIFNNIHSLIIGRYYTAADVGYYQRGQQIPQSLMLSIDGSMTEVLYPVFSKVQGNDEQLKDALRRSIKTSMYVVLPIMAGLCVVSEPLTLLLLTDKWLPSVPFMQIQCAICMFWPLSHRSHALNAMGRSDVTFKLSIIGKCITLGCIFSMLKFGIYALMVGTLLASFLSFGVTSYYVNKHLNYSIFELMSDIWKTLISTSLMVVVVWILGEVLSLSLVMSLVVQVIVGIVTYVLLSVIFKIESFKYILSIVSSFICKKAK